VFGTIAGLGAAISGPAGTWASKLPEGIHRLQERLRFLAPPIQTVQRLLQQVEDLGKAPSVGLAAPAPSTLAGSICAGTRRFAAGLSTTVVLLFFLLASGDTFLRRLVEILPNFSDKRQAVDISQ